MCVGYFSGSQTNKMKIATDKIRVLLADDHAMVREALAEVLEDSDRILVIAQASDGETAVRLAHQQEPDVVVLDYSMHGMDCETAIRQILSKSSQSRILVLTVHENIHYAVKALEAGAHGFILKAAAVDELVKGIRAVHSGRVYVSPQISEKIAENLRTGKGHSGIESLSSREFELLKLISGGKRLQECARAMNITESTASTYRARLMQKLSLTTTAEIIRFGLENGIIS
jgi:DNA-binding NarL/FixJ family response regulator